MQRPELGRHEDYFDGIFLFLYLSGKTCLSSDFSVVAIFLVETAEYTTRVTTSQCVAVCGPIWSSHSSSQTPSRSPLLLNTALILTGRNIAAVKDSYSLHTQVCDPAWPAGPTRGREAAGVLPLQRGDTAAQVRQG